MQARRLIADRRQRGTVVARKGGGGGNWGRELDDETCVAPARTAGGRDRGTLSGDTRTLRAVAVTALRV
jgi:hypothetical protein